jgi:reversibly glycosylated polypeptide/UDP-arabinopyranose mutase
LPPGAVVVVPTIRETSILAFLEAWREPLAGVPIVVVEDNPEKSFPLARPGLEHYAWDDIDRELGERAWIIPRRTDCVRSFGYWKAWQSGAEMIVTLDDDCVPNDPDFLGAHRGRLERSAGAVRWVSTGTGVKPRGMPYDRESDERPCALNHGLWTGVPDLDAITQLVSGPDDFAPIQQIVPPGAYFPMCGMNLAFTRALAPAMYFLLMGQGWPYDRFGDIWCGVIAKKICDHLGLAVASGRPFVEHARASDVHANLRKELPGYEANETFWLAVDRIVLTERTVGSCYREIAAKLALTGPYWQRLRDAMAIWADLFG